MYIDNVPDFIYKIKVLEKLYPNGLVCKNPVANNFIFRGMENREYHLLPGIFRKSINKDEETGQVMINDKYLEYGTEKGILKHFIQEASAYINEPVINNYGRWAEIAQHYGTPTRFLDWTTNPLVALYFACESNSKDDAVVWVCHQANYNETEKAIDEERLSDNKLRMELINELIEYGAKREKEKTNLPQFPILYRPYFRDSRMSSQCSYFMVWGMKQKALDEMINDENYMQYVDLQENKEIEYTTLMFSQFFFKFYIHASDKQNIMRELNLMGINAKTLFPGLDGIGRYIERTYRSDYREIYNNFIG